MKENGISVYSCEITALYLEFTHFTQLDAEIPTANGPIVELRKKYAGSIKFPAKKEGYDRADISNTWDVVFRVDTFDKFFFRTYNRALCRSFYALAA